METTAVAVTGISGFLGQRLLTRLDADPAVERVVGLDVREPERRARCLEFHRVDIAGQDLKALLDGVDVVVHLAAVVDPIVDDALMERVNIEGTRRVLDAAGGAGVRTVVRISTAAVYGAWPTNAVPLTEDAPLRPVPGFGPAVQAAEVERILGLWHEEHPGVVLTTLRSAPILGAGAAHLFARVLVGDRRIRVRGASAPVQVAHVDDVASALALAVRTPLPGVYNVAADGWITLEDVDALLPGRARRTPALPAEAAERLLGGMWATGMGDVPPSVVPYLVYPWVLATDRLRARGWEPKHSNEETIMESADWWPAPHTRWPVAAAAIAGGALVWAAARLVRVRGQRDR